MERRTLNRRSNTTALLGLGLALGCILSTACSENPVGRECFIGLDEGTPTTNIIASPALECQSRTCLQIALKPGVVLPPDSEYAPLCTAECDADEDCDKVPESPCVNGFTCAVPVTVGPFCCKKMCICRDYLIIPEEGLPVPAACEPDNPDNTCCNLPGRGECS